MSHRTLLTCLVLLLGIPVNSFAQTDTIINELSEIIDENIDQSALKINFGDNSSYSVSSLDLDYSTSRHELSIHVTYGFYPQKRSIIKVTPYQCNVYSGKWYIQNGEQIQEGSKNIVTIAYNSADYSSTNYALYKDGNTISRFSLEFANNIDALEFAFLVNSLNTTEPKGWYKQELENRDYKNYNSRQVYDLIVKDFKEYQISSAQVHGFEDMHKSKYFKIQYKHPYLLISYSDVTITSWASNFTPGKATLKIDIRDAVFDNPTGWWRNKEEMVISSKSGIEVTFNGDKTLVNTYSFFASELICNKILSKLRVFKRKVLSEGFTGDYGVSHSSSTKQNETKKISDKYVQ